MNSFGLIFDSDYDGNSRAVCVYYLFLIKIGIDFMLTYTGVSCNLNSFWNLNRFGLQRGMMVYQLRICFTRSVSQSVSLRQSTNNGPHDTQYAVVTNRDVRLLEI